MRAPPARTTPLAPVSPRPSSRSRRKRACRRRWRCCAACRCRALQSGPRSWRWRIWRSTAGIIARRVQYGQKALSAGAGRRRRSCCWRGRMPDWARPTRRWPRPRRRALPRPRNRVLPAADVLMLLGRDREARTALETLRDTAGAAHAGAAAARIAGVQSRRLRRSAARFFRAAERPGFLGHGGLLPGGHRRSPQRRRYGVARLSAAGGHCPRRRRARSRGDAALQARPAR